jgi:hypothetical protein
MNSPDLKDSEENYQTVLDISKTLIRSKEVVNQSRNLLNKMNSYNNLNNNLEKDFKLKEYRSLANSHLQTPQKSPTIKSTDFSSYNDRENPLLKSETFRLELEIKLLKSQVKEKDLEIFKYQELIRSLGIQISDTSNIKNPSFNNFENFYSKDIEYRMHTDEKRDNKKFYSLENKLNHLVKEYNKQVVINLQLKKKLEDCKSQENEKKISEIQEKVFVSNNKFKKLSERLDRTEAMLSSNVTPIRLEKCDRNSMNTKPRIKKKSCVLINHKSKNLY